MVGLVENFGFVGGKLDFIGRNFGFVGEKCFSPMGMR